MDGPDTPAHYHDLAAVERSAWDMLVRGALSRKSAFHQCTVATLARDGRPAARTVVLRGAEREAKTLRFHTDTRSNKFAELSHDPRAEIHFYDHGAKVQVRARGTVTLHNQDEATHAIWAGMRDMSKACYRQALGPGAPVAEPSAAEQDPLSDAGGYQNFVVAILSVEALEWLYLAAKGHRRALIGPSSSAWLAP